MKIARINEFAMQADNRQSSLILLNEKLHPEKAALDELEAFSDMEGISQLVFTPDFHKGNGTPIGTVALVDRVYPKIVGNDIGCGMRLDILTGCNINPKVGIPSSVIDGLRHAFFEGGREIFVSDRRRILSEGLYNFIGGSTGYFQPAYYQAHGFGSLGNGDVSDVLQPYTDIEGPRDNHLGTIGGGNHFVEIQQVDEIIDGTRAWELGLGKGGFCVMSHSGSLDNGQQVGNHFNTLSVRKWEGKHPKNGFFHLSDLDGEEYIKAANNAANFATVNRLMLACMVTQTLKCQLKSVYDAPHNFVAKTNNGYLHRKGACPAALDELVIIPGSMGTRSFLGLGNGSPLALQSAPHGAGRSLSRNKARAQDANQDGIRLITKVDPAKVRSDIAREVMKNLSEEAPSSYKDIEEVVNTSVMAGLVRPVAWLKPVLTIKG